MRMHCQRNKYQAFIQKEHFQLAAIKIQTAFRRHRAQSYVLMELSDVIVCQSAVRRFLSFKRRTQLKEERCATIIQATWRRFIASEYYILILSDIIVCQSVVRRKFAVTRYNDLLARREVAAVSIQKVLRGFSKRLEYHIMVADVIYAQSLVRRRIAMTQLCILRQIRRLQEENAATRIQTAYRGFVRKNEYLTMRSLAVILQSAVRSIMAMKKVRSIRRANKAATTIRAVYLGFITRMNYIITLNSAITCQSAIRVMHAKRRLHEARCVRLADEYTAATKIQSAYRRYEARMEHIITISSVIICQSAIRKWLAKVSLMELQQIQWAKEDYAATTIRAAYLGFTARINYILTVADIITIQKYLRGHYARKLLREMILKRRIEEVASEQLHKSRENAAIQIQKIFRGFVVYEYALTSLANAIYLQANIRAFLAKIELKRRRQMRDTHQCAIRIQTAWRSYKAQTNFALAIWGVISIQSLHRRNVTAFMYKQIQANQKRSAVTLQSSFRRHMVIRRLSSFYEVRAMVGGRNIMDVEYCSSKIIQKRWKYYLMQRKVKDDLRMRMISENKAATTIVSEIIEPIPLKFVDIIISYIAATIIFSKHTSGVTETAFSLS